VKDEGKEPIYPALDMGASWLHPPATDAILGP